MLSNGGNTSQLQQALPSSDQPARQAFFFFFFVKTCLTRRWGRCLSLQGSHYETSSGPFLRNNAWERGPGQPTSSGTRHAECRFAAILLVSLYRGSPLLPPPKSQPPVVLTSSPFAPPPPLPLLRFVSMDPTELILGRAVIAPQYSISNLNASLPGLMELIRLWS